MPQDDPAPIEGGALQFFATEFGAIVNSFAEHGFRDPPLRISIAVREMLAERALVHDRLDAANRMDQTVTELTQALAGCRTALRETEIALGEAKAEVLSLSVAAGEANSLRGELRDLRIAFENMAVREKKAIDRADRANDRAIAALAPPQTAHHPLVITIGKWSAHPHAGDNALAKHLRGRGVDVWQVYDNDTLSDAIARAEACGRTVKAVYVFPLAVFAGLTEAQARSIDVVFAEGRAIDWLAEQVLRPEEPKQRVPRAPAQPSAKTIDSPEAPKNLSDQ